MEQTKKRLKALFIHTVIFLQITAIASPLPVRIFAEDANTPTDPAPVETVYGTPPEGTARPNGVAGHTYRYNLTTGLWENDYFIWNPNTNETTPRQAAEHKLNQTTNTWEVWQWKYVASEGTYRYRIIASYPAAVAEPATTPENPDSSDAPDITGGTPTADTSSTQTTLQPSASTAVSVPVTTAGSALLSTSTSEADYTVVSDLSIDNTINSAAVTGNANVIQNTVAGDATTGDALAMANILNMLQSTWGSSGMTPEIYLADIQGDHYGDIVLDPSILGVSGSGCDCELEVNVSTDASINNDIDLLAQSGDATVSKNTSAGDATTGDATALANVINMINSSITSGTSFIGVLNIHGDFEGDVLVADDVIDELLAANVPTTEISLCDCADLTADLTNNFTIDNNIITSATSGAAHVGYNTSAGDATTGDARSSITVFNLTGQTVVGDNALLVFVNVLGEWVGFITDAPGASAAMYGSGITQNSVCQHCGESDYNVDQNITIRNNLNLAAVTGDAHVTYNTSAGDATTGDAQAAAHVSNITGSNFAMNGWFGMLFINVLGNWHGSFGTDTLYGGILSQPNNPVRPVHTNRTQKSPLSQSTTDHSSRQLADTGSVKVYTASFTTDEDGNTVLSHAAQADPPSRTAGYAQPDADNNTIAWALLISGSILAYYLFRRKPGSHGSSL